MTEGIYDAGRAALAFAQHCKCNNEYRGKVGRYGCARSLCERQRRKGTRKAGKTYAFAALLILALGVVFAPNAYAADTNFTIYGPTAFVWDGTTYYEVGVVAANKYDAALVALNYDPADNDKFTSEVKAKLSNEGFGGSFWDFAQNFEAPPTDGGTVTQTGIQPGFWSTAYSLYGQGNVWYGKFGWVQKVQAYAAVEAVLDGNDLGGGSGGGSAEAPDSINLPFVDNWKRSYDDNYNPNLVAGASNVITSQIKAQFNNVDSSYYKNISVWLGNYSIGGSSGTGVAIVFSQNAPTKNYTNTGSYTEKKYYLTGLGDYIVLFYRGSNVTSTSIPANVDYLSQVQGYNLTCLSSGPSYSRNGNGTLYLNPSANNNTNGTVSYMAYVVSYSAGPVIPETNWPEPGDPVPEPDPPDVPDVPDDDPIDQPNPVNPTPSPQPTDVVGGTPPQYDPIIYPVDSTYTVDIQGILDAMAEHCRHIQAALHTLGENLSDNLGNAIFDNTSWLYDMVYSQFGWIGNLIKTEGQSLRSNIYGNVGYLGDTIVDEFDSLKTYLQSLFTWLGQQMNYTVNIDKDSYDDSSVLYWLKRIWAKLGAGDINTRPTDPVADPWDIGEWLKQLWANFTADLIAMGADLLADLAMDLRDLVTKFPFSIPWDLAALLAVLAAEPVAPTITWPWFTVGTNGSIVSTNITVSLADYDAYLGGVRTMEKLLFVGYLLFRVKDDIALLFSGGLDA